MKFLIHSKDIFFDRFFYLDFSLSKIFHPVDSKKVSNKRTNDYANNQSFSLTKNIVRSFWIKRTKKKERPVDSKRTNWFMQTNPYTPPH